MKTIFWSKNLKERDRAEDQGIDVMTIWEWILWKRGGNWFIGFEIRNSGELLWTR